MNKRDDRAKKNEKSNNETNNQELFDQLMHDLEEKRNKLNEVAEKKYESGESLADIALCEEQQEFNEASIRLQKLMKDLQRDDTND